MFSANVTCAFLAYRNNEGEIHRNKHFLSQKNGLFFQIFDQRKVFKESGVNQALYHFIT